MTTQDETEEMRPAEEYIQWLFKPRDVPCVLSGHEKDLIAGNVRGFHAWMLLRRDGNPAAASMLDEYDEAVESMESSRDGKIMHKFRERIRKLELADELTQGDPNEFGANIPSPSKREAYWMNLASARIVEINRLKSELAAALRETP